jgi:hypothetical protein
VAGAVKRVAIFAGMTKVPMPRGAGMAFTGFDRHQPFRAMCEALELNGGKRVGRGQKDGACAHEDFHFHRRSSPLVSPDARTRPCYAFAFKESRFAFKESQIGKSSMSL